MKKLFGACMVLAMLGGATAAFATVANTPHDVTAAAAAYGLCEACHIPHGGGSDRLWAQDLSTITDVSGDWSTTTTGPLCINTCHATNSALNTIGGHFVQLSVAALSSHGPDIPDLPALDGTPAAGNGLKYWPAGGGDKTPTAERMECTTCHNVHDNATRPFLRQATGSTSQASVDALCEGCHARENTGPLVGALNTATAGDGTTVGSLHPTDVAYSSTSYSLKATINAALNTSRGVASQGAVSVALPLGGHLLSQIGDATTGNLGCDTCHAVHGNDAAAGLTDLLAIDNALATGPSALCQGCHDGGAGTGTVMATNLADHPIDGVGRVRALLAADMTNLGSTTAIEPGVTNWPTYLQATVNYTVSCSSCHTAHFGIAGETLKRTGGNASWCDSCHPMAGAVPNAHHSVQGNWASSVVVCADCHGSVGPMAAVDTTDMNAHGGFGSIPWADAWATANTDSAYNWCHACHDGGASVGGISPRAALTNGELDLNSTPNPSAGYTLPRSHGDKATGSNLSSHKIGADADAGQLRTAAWWGTSFSKFGGSANSFPATRPYGMQTVAPATANNNEVICLSCHSIMGNVGLTAGAENIAEGAITLTSGFTNNLLLYPYADDQHGTAAGSGQTENTTSIFCVGCHDGIAVAMASVNERTDKPTGTHPTAQGTSYDTISAAVDASRGTTTLITTAGTYADQALSPNNASYPAASNMDCDSCHRPHDADTDASDSSGYNYILEQAGPSTGSRLDGICSQCHLTYGAVATD